MSFRHHVVMFLATGGLVGRIPVAPGTMGSVVGLVVAYFFSGMNCLSAAACVIGLILAAVWIAHQAERELLQKDPGCIVIDEIAGVCVTLLCIPITVYTAIAAFFLFRLFDIAKPFPIRYFERRFAGGWGVVLDDVAAGIMAHVVLRIGLAMNS